MYYFFIFMIWTLLMYVTHRLCHTFTFLSYFHIDHHNQINTNNNSSWKWYHIFIWVDTWKSTVDQWTVEVIPTILFCWLTGQWWILLFYWIWSAFIQEIIEHNSNVNFYPFLTSGKWHLLHHNYENKNYGLFTPIWDILLRTHAYKR